MVHVRGYEHAAKVWDDTHDYNIVLECLRSKGVSKLDSIKALREFCGVSLAEAKRIANESDVWRDTVADTERLHDALWKGAIRVNEDDSSR